MPPMPFVPAPSTVLLRFMAEYYGDTIVNDISVKKIASAWTDTEMLDLCQNLDAAWAANIIPLLNEHYIYTKTQVRDISVPTGRYFEFVGSAATPGGITGNGSPGNVTYRIFFKTGFPVRGGRPGNSVSGLTQSNVIGNTINSAWAGLMHAAYNLLGPAINGSGLYYWAKVSKIAAGVARAEAAVIPVTSTSYNTKVHTMGKRINGK